MTNPLSLETSDLDPITPEEDVVATKAIVAMGWTRQSYDSAVRMVRVVVAEMGWQPIETASQDIWARSQQIICGHSEKGWVRFGRYYGELKRWYYSGTNERTQWAETPGDAPTHWQPLPDIRSLGPRP